MELGPETRDGLKVLKAISYKSAFGFEGTEGGTDAKNYTTILEQGLILGANDGIGDLWT